MLAERIAHDEMRNQAIHIMEFTLGFRSLDEHNECLQHV